MKCKKVKYNNKGSAWKRAKKLSEEKMTVYRAYPCDICKNCWHISSKDTMRNANFLPHDRIDQLLRMHKRKMEEINNE